MEIKNNEVLPKGWISEDLVNIADKITKGSTPTTYGFKFQNSGIRFIKTENILNGCVIHSSLKDFISEEAHYNQKRSILEIGEILFSIAGSIGVTCLVNEKDLPANINQALAIIRGTQKVFIPQFIQYQLVSHLAKKQISHKARGGGMNNISLEDVKRISVCIPPLNEQRRIVAKLEKLLAKVDTCKERLDKIPAILKRFRQSVLSAACSGRLTADWRENNPDVESAEKLLKRIQEERKKRYEEMYEKARQEGKRKPVKPKNITSLPLEEEGLDKLQINWKWTTFNEVCDDITVG